MVIRLAAIGLGGLAHVQLDVLADRDDAAVVAGADIDPDARERFEAAFDAPAYEDYAVMLDAEDLDAVTIVTPHTLHYEQTRECLERGLHVHVEKPMVARVDHGVEIIDLADRNDRVLQVGYQRHFHPGYREVREVAAGGEIGEVHMASCHLAQDWIDGQAGTWRTNPELSGGGQLSDSGSHLLDALLWTTDSEPVRVAAVTDYREHDVDVNSALAATLDGPDGPITASIGVSGDGTEFEEGLFIWGTEGHAAYTGGELTVRAADGTTRTAEPDAGDYREQTETKLEAFLEAVRGERAVAVPGEFGLRVTALTQAAYEADETGETVDVRALIEEARADL